MARLTLHATGRASPELVWERYASLDEWAAWSPQIKAVHCPRRRLTSGMSGTVESVAGVRAAFTVEAVDHQGRQWSWRVRLGPVALRLGHEVRAHADGSTTTLTTQGPRLALLAYAPLARLALHRLVRP
ncbi:SRPBCC family protein [Streptomyces sp. NPDC001046]|uniref:SRPBCC family protein n=1 Tax=unclassified Streptomyces TaxID=2593676 RepID=UPI00363D420D